MLGASGKSRSTTRSGISGTTITVRDAEGQQALTGKSADDALAALNRGVSTEVDGTNALKPIFDENKIKAGFEIVAGLQREMGTFLNNRAKEADTLKQARDNEADPARRADLDRQYQDASKWGPGGTYRQIATALTAAAGGNVAGSTSQFVQSAAVGYLQGIGANQVKQMVSAIGDGSPAAETARAALHAIVGCAGAAGAGQACGAGAMGAAASSVIGSLMAPADGLSAEQKEARLDIVRSLVAGIAGASGVDAGTAANAATFEGENNFAGPRPNPGRPGPPGKPGQQIEPYRTPGKLADPGEATLYGQPDGSAANEAEPLKNPIAEVVDGTVQGIKRPHHIPLQVFVGLGPIASSDGNADYDRVYDGRTIIENKTLRGTSIESVPNSNVDTANRDFRALNPQGVRTEITKRGPVKIGTLDDGSKVILRPSKDGRTTIEFQNGRGRTKREIRYGEK